MVESSTTVAESPPPTESLHLTGAESASNSQSVTGGAAANNDVAASPGRIRRTRVRKANRQAVAGPIEHAVALRDSLRESLGRTNELIRTLKRHRQQSRLVATTLASLKELQAAG